MKTFTRYPATVALVMIALMLATVATIIPGPVSVTFITGDHVQFLANLAIGAVLVAIGERLMGSRRAAWIFVIGGLIGVNAGAGIQYITFLMGDFWSLGTNPREIFDPIAPALAVVLAGSAFAPRLWRRRIRVIALGLTILFASYATTPADLYRLSCAVVGLCIGLLMVRGGAVQPVDVAPRVSRRRFLATITTITALGPLLALLRPAGLSPLSIISSIATGELVNPQSVLDTCGLGSRAACERGLLVISNHGPGMTALSFVPVALILLAAWGIARGRRFGMYLAITVNVVLSIIALISLNIPALINTMIVTEGNAPQLPEFALAVVLAVVLPLGVAVMLLINREVFGVRAPVKVIRRFVIEVTATFSILFTTLVVWSTVLAAPTNFSPTPWYYLNGALKRFLPGRMLDQPRALQMPKDAFGGFLYQWVGLIFWIIFILAAIRVLASTHPAGKETRQARVLELIKRGGSSMSYMSLWPGNTYWFSADGEAVVTYRVIRGIALTLGEPICKPGEELRRIHEFAAYCDRHHWIPVFYSVHENVLPAFESIGWQSAPVGQESHLVLSDIDISSRQWQKVRHAHNRAGREEVTALWTTWDELPHTQQRQVESISQSWTSTRSIPEMGFTLGTAAQLRDPHVGLMLAVDAQDKIHGITSWLPVYRDGSVVGWTLDFMRRSDEGFPGVMEFLIGATALKWKAEGLEELSLSGVPLVRKPRQPLEGEERDPITGPITTVVLAREAADQPKTALDRLQAFLSKRLEPAYGFASLMFFKSKFHPRYETLYMAYSDPVALPQIARAIGRAYLPDITTRSALKLFWGLRRKK
jgi:phosphatidylglycerol lysyltransferase